MGTEAAVTDGDAPFGAEPGSHQRMVHARHGEGNHGQRGFATLEAGPEEGDPGDVREALSQAEPERGLVLDDPPPADGPELVDGSVECYRAHDVGRAGLLAV